MSESTKDHKREKRKHHRSSEERNGHDRRFDGKREGKSSANSHRSREEEKSGYRGSESWREDEKRDGKCQRKEINREYEKKRRIERDEEKDERRDEGNKMEQKPSWDNKRVQRHAEMIQERKLLWKGRGKNEEEMGDGGGDQGTSQMGKNEIAQNNEKKLENKWTSMIAAAAKDTQQMDKFQRLMGLKKNAAPKEEAKVAVDEGGESIPADPLTVNKDELEREKSRQMNMQRDLDKQFEMARHTHHSARGRGLGSF